jgi:transposase
VGPDLRQRGSGGGDRGVARARGVMIPVPSGVRVWLATGPTDMRRGMNGLAIQVQETLRRDAHSGHLFVFRGKRGDRVT